MSEIEPDIEFAHLAGAPSSQQSAVKAINSIEECGDRLGGCGVLSGEIALETGALPVFRDVEIEAVGAVEIGYQI